MPRIRRIGLDTVVNYSFLQTSSYDEDAPAVTTSAWPDDEAMDQTFKQASPTEVTAEGVLITFERFPDAFNGAMVKVHPTYDTDAGETPALEMWVHDSENVEWVKRNRIDLTNPFVGVATGARKVFDFTFFPFERNIDKVWITMDPGSTGSPLMKFTAIKLYGQCEGSLNRTTPGTEDPCADPNDPFYTGFDDEGQPCPGTTFEPPIFPEIPALDLCNPASIAQYREAVSLIPGFVEIFDAWLDARQEEIALFCAGVTDEPPDDQPEPPLPPLPPLDLCDEESIEAFRAAIGGSAENLAAFEAFLTALEEVGFFELTCPPADPPEEYVDPESMEPAEEPDPNTDRPFDQGPGGVPDKKPAVSGSIPDASGGDTPVPAPIDNEFNFFAFYGFQGDTGANGGSRAAFDNCVIAGCPTQGVAEAWQSLATVPIYLGPLAEGSILFTFGNTPVGSVIRVNAKLIEANALTPPFGDCGAEGIYDETQNINECFNGSIGGGLGESFTEDSLDGFPVSLNPIPPGCDTKGFLAMTVINGSGNRQLRYQATNLIFTNSRAHYFNIHVTVPGTAVVLPTVTMTLLQED